MLRAPDARNPTVGPQRGAANVSDGRGTSLSLAEARKAEGGIQGKASSASAAASLTGLGRLAQTWERSCPRAPCWGSEFSDTPRAAQKTVWNRGSEAAGGAGEADTGNIRKPEHLQRSQSTQQGIVKKKDQRIRKKSSLKLRPSRMKTFTSKLKK